MKTLVVNGEPVVYWENHYPGFRRFMYEVSGEWGQINTAEKQINLLHQSITEHSRNRLPLNISGRVFQFIIKDCCATSRQESYTTIPVKRKNGYMDVRRISGCRCPKCGGPSSYYNYSPIFLKENLGVRFEI